MTWNPETYNKFEKERFQPFADLIKLINIRNHLNVIDLGCGTGALTADLRRLLPGSNVIGIDTSPQMIAKAKALETDNLRFELDDIENVNGNWDLIFSNAALHWIPQHEDLIPRLLQMLNPYGQLVVQTPSNHRNPVHHMIINLADKIPYSEALNGWYQEFHMLPIDEYADLLYAYGGREITIFDKGYCHELSNAEAILDWVLGTTLVPYMKRLPEKLKPEFKKELLDLIKQRWQRSPVLFLFRRILFSVTMTD